MPKVIRSRKPNRRYSTSSGKGVSAASTDAPAKQFQSVLKTTESGKVKTELETEAAVRLKKAQSQFYSLE
jgi:hypothetical protein